MTVESIPKAINHRADLGPIVAGCCRGGGILAQLQQARLKNLVLLDVTFHRALVASQLFELRKEHILLDVMVVMHETTPKGNKFEEVILVLGLVHVERLEVDAVHASDQRVVKIGHLVGGVDGAMRLLFSAIVVSI